MKLRILFLTTVAPVLRKFRIFLLHLKGYKNISYKSVVEHDVKLDRVNPAGIHLGDFSSLASGTAVLSHEHVFRNPNDYNLPYMAETTIGKRCAIGINVIILCGVHIGDECIIGAGSIVTKDIPSHSIAVGVPARVIKSGIRMDDNHILIKEHKEENANDK